MAKWKKRQPRMRRAYLRLDNVTTKPLNAGLHREGMGELYRHIINPSHDQAFDDLHGAWVEQEDKKFQRIKRIMEMRTKMVESKLHNRFPTKSKFYWIILQQSKYFKLLLCWNAQFCFVKQTPGLLSVSRPYDSRNEAMEAHSSRCIFWLDNIPIPAQ